MPFDIPLGEQDPGVASVMMGIMQQHQDRQNSSLQMQLADLNVRQMAMQQNASEAAQRFSIEQQKMEAEKEYRNQRLDQSASNQDGVNARFAQSLQDKQAGRTMSADYKDQNIALREQGLAQQQQSIDNAKAAAEARLNATAKGRPLTDTAKATIHGLAGKAGITDLTPYQDEQGTIDYNRLSQDANTGIQGNSITGESKTKAQGFVAALEEISKVKDPLQAMAASGREPSAWQKGLARSVSTPPTGIVSSLTQSAQKQFISQDASDRSAMLARLKGIYVRVQAGLAQTGQEIANVTPYAPQEEDSAAVLQSKLNSLEQIAQSNIYGFTRKGSELRQMGQQSQSNSTNTPTTSAPSLGAGGTSTLNRDEAMQYLRQAGGDKEKARELARRAGHSF